MNFLASLLFAVVLSSTMSFALPISRIESFPGKVKVLVDINDFASAKLDVLFVVDNSGSMQNHQDNLLNNIHILLQHMDNSRLDFHAGVVTTDQGILVGNDFVSPATPNWAYILKQKLMVGTTGSGHEKIFEPIQTALSSNKHTGFLRKDANLAIILMTDAEDQSVNISPEDFVKFLKSLKGNLSKVTVQGLIIPTEDTTLCPRDENATPVRIEKALELLEGHAYGLCDASFGENIRSIAHNLLKHPTLSRLDKVKLPSVPVFNSIEVNFGSQIIPKGDLLSGWIFDSATNNVIFGEKIIWSNQPNETLLEITYVPEDWAL